MEKKNFGTRLPADLARQFLAEVGARGIKKELAFEQAIRVWLGKPPAQNYDKWCEITRRARAVRDSRWRQVLYLVLRQLEIIAAHADGETEGDGYEQR